MWKCGSSVLIGIGLLTMSILVGIFSSINFDFGDALASVNNGNNTTTGTSNNHDQIFGNIMNGNQYGYQSFKNYIYYQVKTGSILNALSISNAGDRINNILYDNDQRTIILVLTPSQNKSGILEIDLPRNIIDSRIYDEDKNFTVLVNNQPAKYQEIIDKNNSNITSPSVGSNTSSGEYTLDNDIRKLIIEFGKDARVIKIIGTELNNMTSQNQSGLDKILRQIIPIIVNNKIHYTSVQLKGGSLNDLQLESNSKIKTLILDIISYNENGELSIDLPRNIIDSRIYDEDKNFTVLVNNQPAKYQEIIDKNNSNITSPSVGSNTSSGEYTLDNDIRKLIIEFGKDARVIKIIGTELNNMTSQNQSGFGISKSNDIPGGDQNPSFLVPSISIFLGIIIVVVYLKYRKSKVKSSK
ncbi:hypothetical protein NMY3_01926 [Candidatus Nitrosocosmicus oleophilus]|uniref:Uncharacterized protein n=2 Tax=Candidatus Nitrosocosmicus oleophilus TaxID=1353260 RepID=A0A654M0V3_9ARCH|nr:hypothetical protein NMY3_01926 [Candidatus Nitrosocosmicus oleophilus]